MNTDDLYLIARRRNIEIDEIRMRGNVRAVSFPQCWIAIDPRRYNSSADYNCDLAHEIGHCETASFYNDNTPTVIRAVCERRANKYAVFLMMPFDRVKTALRSGYVTVRQLAEYFDVTYQFAAIAVSIYSDRIRELDRHDRCHHIYQWQEGIA